MERNENELSEYLNKAKKESEALSEEIAKELSDTMTDMQKETLRNLSSITSEAISNERLYLKESEQIQNAKSRAETKYLAQLQSTLERVKGLRNEELRCLKMSYEYGIIGTAEYYSQLENCRDRYFSRGSVKWLEYTDKLLEHNQNILNAQEEALLNACKTTADGIKEQFELIDKEQEKLKNKLGDFGGIAQKNILKTDSGDIPFFSLSNLGAQNDMLEEYLHYMTLAQEKINSIWKTGTGDEKRDEKNIELRNSYFAQIRDMSITDATDFARLIKGVSMENLAEHLGEYERRQELSESISKSLFASEITDTATLAGKNLGEEFTDALADELSELDGKFFTSGESACKSFGEGFLASLSEVMAKLTASIDINAIIRGGTGSNVENNTSYNIYQNGGAEDTLRLLREKEEMKSMLLD